MKRKKPKWVKLGPFYLNFRRRFKLKWGGRWDLNPRQPESQSGALPTELRPPQKWNAIVIDRGQFPVNRLKRIF